jgi:hypothetical protein
MANVELAGYTATLKKLAVARGLDAGAGWVAQHDETMYVYASISFFTPTKAEPNYSFTWRILVKPFAADDLMWRHLFPDSDMGGERKKLALRATGAFRLDGLPLTVGSQDIEPANYEAQVGNFLSAFEAQAAPWMTGGDSLERFIALSDDLIATSPSHKLSRWNLHRTTALLAAGRDAEALANAQSEVVAGRDGGLFDGDKSINDLIVEHLTKA